MGYETEDSYYLTLQIDEKYEFDASRFFDFTKAEFDSEIEEAERWFEISGDYPNSPFIVKLNMEKLLSVEVVPGNSSSKDSSIKAKSINNNSEIDSRHGVSQTEKTAKGTSFQTLKDTPLSKPTSNNMSQTRILTLMKPTASHIAKQNKTQDLNSSCSCTRFRRSSMKIGEMNSQSATILDNLDTKRQKLDIGFLRKVARLKHQIALPHKISKKVTVPREPELETHLRALRRRPRNSSALRESENPKEGCGIKARPINRKVLQTSLLAKQIKSKPQVQPFQVLTVHKINSCASSGAANYKKPNSGGILKSEKHETSMFPVIKESEPIQEDLKLSIDKKILESPPMEQFTMLSL